LEQIKKQVIDDHVNNKLIENACKDGTELGYKLFGGQWTRVSGAMWLSVRSSLDLSNLAMINKTTEYLKVKNDSAESLNFAREAVKTYGNGGEVDYDNEILKDKSFIGTKADCVLKSLISKGNNLFKKTSEAFTGNKSKYNLNFVMLDKLDAALARTPFPESEKIITINMNSSRIETSSAMNIASIIIHETIHAELHRIILTNNSGPNPLPSHLYEWYTDIWKRYEGLYSNPQRVATAAEHNYMAYFFIDPITNSLREFDDRTHPLINYKSFAWTGLESYGKDAGLITQSEIDNLVRLSSIIGTDGHSNPCD